MDVTEWEKDGMTIDYWLYVDNNLKTVQPGGKKIRRGNGWKTVRIFVSSTFEDFFYERDVLVKKVFPDLRKKCQTLKLHLLDYDLRWGAPPHFNKQQIFKMSMGAIEKCMEGLPYPIPFFINMTSRRTGWIPQCSSKCPDSTDTIDQKLLDGYGVTFGFSVTEMEIVYGAYSARNPNAMFLFRDDSFHQTLPKEVINDFDYENENAKKKVALLQHKLRDRYQELEKVEKNKNIIKYKAAFKTFNEDGNVILTIKEEDELVQYLHTFFWEKIEDMFPKPSNSNKFEEWQLTHQAFMEYKTKMFIGRGDILTKIENHMTDDGKLGDKPLLVLGKPGIGKSTVIAQAVSKIIHKFKKEPWHIFYHFVGAVPGSTELLNLLQRLLKELNNLPEHKLPKRLEDAIQMTNSMLNNPATKKVIIIVDALNQLDDINIQAALLGWIPSKLSDRVRCVFSSIPESRYHVVLKERESTPVELKIKPLQWDDKEAFVKEWFEQFGKKLDKMQLNQLLQKESSDNPLWLTLACEELRVHGDYNTITDGSRIRKLSHGLERLIEQVLDRFANDTEDDMTKHLIKATLCLIEVSKRGLLEAELYYILGDEKFYSQYDKAMQDVKMLFFEEIEPTKRKRYTDESRLSSFHWNLITRSLGVLLRPYGDLGEGRLNFYHKSVSDAVKQKYFNDLESKIYWHFKLAHYYEFSRYANEKEALERKVEEYPYHLVQLQHHLDQFVDFWVNMTIERASERLREFLVDWDVFEQLYDCEYSSLLLYYWNQCGGFEKMSISYKHLLKHFEKEADKESVIIKYEQVGRIILQAGLFDEARNVAKLLKNIKTDSDEHQVLFSMLMSDILSKQFKQANTLKSEQIPIVSEAMKYSGQSVKTLALLTKKNPDKYQRLYHLYLVRHGCSHADLADILTYTDKKDLKKAEKIRSEGACFIEEAKQQLFGSEEKGMIAELVKAEGTIKRGQFSVQMKLFKEALALSKEAYGECSLLTARILNNMGNTYQDRAEYENEMENYRIAREYLIKSHKVYKEVCGPEHSETKSALAKTDCPLYNIEFGKYPG